MSNGKIVMKKEISLNSNSMEKIRNEENEGRYTIENDNETFDLILEFRIVLFLIFVVVVVPVIVVFLFFSYFIFIERAKRKKNIEIPIM